jgi:hypothetical protein
MGVPDSDLLTIFCRSFNMCNLSVILAASSFGFGHFLMLMALVWFIFLAYSLLRDQIRLSKRNKRRKNPESWDYEFYKTNRHIIDYLSLSFLEKLAESSLTANEIKEKIDNFNSLDNEEVPLTVNLFIFEKQLKIEKEPACRLAERKVSMIQELSKQKIVKSSKV